MLKRTDVQQHKSRKSCWIVINKQAYDVTTFLDSHPGGSAIILKYAGKDATKAYTPIHPDDTLQKYLKPDQHLGTVEDEEAPVRYVHPLLQESSQGTSTEVVKPKKKPRLASIINMDDFEKAAELTMSKRGFAYMRAGADSELAVDWNRKSWQKIRFRPRVLVPVEQVDMRTTIFGNDFDLPFFICPAGGPKLAHPGGEVLMTKAAGRHKALHWVANLAGCTKKEIADARRPGQVLYWQIYAAWDLEVSAAEVREAERLGYKGFALTVDAVRNSKRERDVRAALAEDDDEDVDELEEEVVEDDEGHKSGPTVHRASIWPKFDWISSVKWLRSLTDLPITVKGIQTWEDALLCYQHGAHPWLSNHGGRQLEAAPSAAETLLEIRRYCPQVLKECDVIVDGGIRRGSDVVKALALGARAVGLGRSFLFALTYGEAGVSKAFQILQHEVETTMALLGVTSIAQLTPEYVNAQRLENVIAKL